MTSAPADDARAFGVVANVTGRDRVLKMGARVWIVSGWGGGGWERLKVRGLSRSNRTVTKWIATADLDGFRCKWVPEDVRADMALLGERARMEDFARGFQNRAPAETEQGGT